MRAHKLAIYDEIEARHDRAELRLKKVMQEVRDKADELRDKIEPHEGVRTIRAIRRESKS